MGEPNSLEDLASNARNIEEFQQDETLFQVGDRQRLEQNEVTLFYRTAEVVV